MRKRMPRALACSGRARLQRRPRPPSRCARRSRVARTFLKPRAAASPRQYAQAGAVKPGFDAGVREISDELGTTHAPLIPGELKGVGRAAEKIMADYSGDASKIKDLVRATTVIDRPEDAEGAIAAGAREVRRADRPAQLARSEGRTWLERWLPRRENELQCERPHGRAAGERARDDRRQEHGASLVRAGPQPLCQGAGSGTRPSRHKRTSGC